MAPAFSAAPTFVQHKANQCVSCASNQVVVTLTSNVTAGNDLWETGEAFTAKPNQHPVDFSWLNVSGASDSTLNNSNADMVSPSARISPAANCGTGTPACKVNVNDSDQTYFGMERHGADQPELCVGELHRRELGDFHGSLPDLLVERKPQPVPEPRERGVQRSEYALGQQRSLHQFLGIEAR